MSTKLLLAAFAILAVANATDVYTATWSSSTSCAGNPNYASKMTLDQCFTDTDNTYDKMTESGGTYTFGANYATNACSGSPAATVSGAADACVAYGSGSVKILSQGQGSTEYNSAASFYDCSSGTCICSNGACANGLTVYTATWSSSTSCSGNPTWSSKLTTGLCYKDTDGTYDKLFYSLGQYRLQANSANSDCSGDHVDIGPAAAGTCASAGTGSAKILTTAAYDTTATSGTYDCTSGTCNPNSNSASHATIGIIAVFVGLVAHLIA